MWPHPGASPWKGYFFRENQDQSPWAPSLRGSWSAGPSGAGGGRGCLRAHPSLSLLAQRQTLSSASLQGHIALEPRPAAVPPPRCWVAVCPLRPRLPQPSRLPSCCPRGPSQARGLRGLGVLLWFSRPRHREYTLTLRLEPAGSFEGEIELMGRPPQAPATHLHQPWGGWDSPRPEPGPEPRPSPASPCWEKREAGAHSISAPGSQRPRASLGQGGGWLAAPFYKYCT